MVINTLGYNSTFPNSSLGALIWRSNGNGIVVKENTLSGMGAGVMYQEFSNEPITNDLETIVTTFGSKTR